MTDIPSDLHAEQIHLVLESDLPLSELVRVFPSRLEAYRSYAEHMARRCLRPLSDRCERCRGEGAVSEYVYTWEAGVTKWRHEWLASIRMALALGPSPVAPLKQRVEFETHHHVCDGCERRLARRRTLAWAANYFLLVVCLVVGTAAYLLLTVAVVSRLLPFTWHGWDMTTLSLGGAIAAICGVGGCALGFLTVRWFSIPSELHEVGRYPFALKSIRLDLLARARKWLP